MHTFMTHETPAKVLSLLGVALVSLGFLFGVSSANASFSGVEHQIPDPIPAEKVMAVLDNVSASYSNFLAENLFNPVSENIAYFSQSAQDAASDFTDQLALHINVASPAPQTSQVAQVSTPRVAGAYTAKYESGKGIIGLLYSVVTQ